MFVRGFVMRLKLGIFLLLGFLTSNAMANTVPTNLDGVVVKNVKCKIIGYQNNLVFNVSNRSSSAVKGVIIATIFDQDSDPIDNGKTSINVGPVSGDKLFIKVDCTTAAKFTFRIE
jgi:hypothetical protein